MRLRPPSSARPEPFFHLHRFPPTASASLGFIPTRLGLVHGHGLPPANFAITITITMPSSGLSSEAQLQHPGASRRSSMQAMPPPFIRQPYAIPRCKSLFFPIRDAQTPLCSSFYPNANMLLSLEQKLGEYPLLRTHIHHHAKSTPHILLLFPQSHLMLSIIPATCRRQSLNLSCWARLHVSIALLSASLLPTAR